jgi:hypothetical protein
MKKLTQIKMKKYFLIIEKIILKILQKIPQQRQKKNFLILSLKMSSFLIIKDLLINFGPNILF